MFIAYPINPLSSWFTTHPTLPTLSHHCLPPTHLIPDMPNAAGAVAPDPSYTPPPQQQPPQQPPFDVGPPATATATATAAPAPKGLLSGRGRRLD